MDNVQLRLIDTLTHVTERLRKAGLTGDITTQMHGLIEKASERCVVAVVGRVKAGKSTFVNAFLGADLAKTGIIETTATINYFHGGDAQQPIRCHWKNGSVTNVDGQFLNHLQSNDEKILREADTIDYLEYFVQNNNLEKVTLVDTPGISSAIDTHQDRVASWLDLQNQMRERHHRDTQTIGSQADAVIYVIGETARTDAQAFLDEFKYVTQGSSRSFNAIGVMAQIDLDEKVIQQREQLARKIASQLQSSLNTVIPVSAGVQIALDHLLQQERVGLKAMIALLRPPPPKEPLPPETLDTLLADSSIYLLEECSLSVAERKQLRGAMPWRVFVTIVRTITDTSLDEDGIVDRLQDIAGFGKLRKILEQHFVDRSIILHSYNVVNAALKIVEEAKFSYLPRFQQRQAEDDTKRKRFLAFLQSVRNAPPVAQELAAFVQERLAPRVDLVMVIDEVEREIRRLKYELEDHDQDFIAIQQLESSTNLFTEAEITELRNILGLYVIELEKRLAPEHTSPTYLGNRLDYWNWKARVGRTSVVVSVAQQAARRYGMVLDMLSQSRL